MTWKPDHPLQKEIWIGDRENMNEYCIRIYWEPEIPGQRSKPWACSFAIFPVIHYTVPADRSTERRCFYSTEEQEIMHTTENLDEAWPETEGSVKWDGCTEIYFKQQHFCSAADLEEFGAAIATARACALECVREESDGWVS